MKDEAEEIIITLTNEETGEDKEYYLLEYLEVEGKEYAVFLPEDKEDEFAVVLKVEGDDFVDIEDEDEFKKVIKELEDQELSLDDESEDDEESSED